MRIEWTAGTWLNPPDQITLSDGSLSVRPSVGSDFWRRTSYGFIHDNGHALLAPLPVGTAMEVSFTGDFERQFDQAGLLVRTGPTRWVKSGVELVDGELHLGAVATHEVSDWSMSPVHAWSGRPVTVRVSRGPDALTVRARCDSEPWRMVRLAPFDGGHDALGGPFTCAPVEPGLTVRFTRWEGGEADTSLHG